MCVHRYCLILDISYRLNRFGVVCRVRNSEFRLNSDSIRGYSTDNSELRTNHFTIWQNFSDVGCYRDRLVRIQLDILERVARNHSASEAIRFGISRCQIRKIAFPLQTLVVYIKPSQTLFIYLYSAVGSIQFDLFV